VDILAQDFLLDLHLAINELEQIASGMDKTGERRRGIDGAIAKLKKYMVKAINNNWLCTAFGESAFILDDRYMYADLFSAESRQ
jgi:hypothetical protein